MSTGKIGSADLSAASATYSDLSGGGINENMVVVVSFCNRNATTVKVRLAIGAGVAPAAPDWKEYDQQIAPNGVLERTQISVSSGEKIWVSSDTANVSADARGLPSA